MAGWPDEVTISQAVKNGRSNSQRGILIVVPQFGSDFLQQADALQVAVRSGALKHVTLKA